MIINNIALLIICTAAVTITTIIKLLDKILYSKKDIEVIVEEKIMQALNFLYVQPEEQENETEFVNAVNTSCENRKNMFGFRNKNLV